VEVTPPTGDYGIDIIMVKKQIPIAVECKKYAWGRPVERGVIQKFHDGMQHHQYENYPPFYHGCVVTTSSFSQPAIDYAMGINQKYGYEKIRLIDHSDLYVLKRKVDGYRKTRFNENSYKTESIDNTWIIPTLLILLVIYGYLQHSVLA
jgi:HJR/Mrr/RecB family endonuclease